jgi:hypothetical protein
MGFRFAELADLGKVFCPNLKTGLSNADFVIEGYVDPREPLREEDPFGNHPWVIVHQTAPTDESGYGLDSGFSLLGGENE